jgi:adenylate cyclase
LEALAEPGGICVSRVVRDQVRDKLAFSFEDMGERQVKNIARPLHVHRIVLGERPALPEPAKGTSAKPALALPDKPSIAVLPFQNMSGDPEQEYFADGMVEEIITALSRIHWLFVIARNSSFTYKGQAIDVKQVGRELGVRYVLEGSVRNAGGRVRITAQLIDAISRTHIWADHFDGSLEDVFELQDKVAASVAGAIEPALQVVETARSASRPTNDLTAYDLYLRAWHNVLSYEKSRIDQALDLLERAATRDPAYGPALALAAYCRQQLEVSGWVEHREANRRTAIDLARRAVQVATDDPTVLGRAALVLGYFGEDIDAALALIDRALALNPSSARAWYWSGYLNLYAGRLSLSIEHFNSSLRLSPRDPTRGRSLAGIGIAQFLGQRYEEAAATLLASLQELPTYAPTYRFLASCYAHMGRLEDAREIVKRLRAFTTAASWNALRGSLATTRRR